MGQRSNLQNGPIDLKMKMKVLWNTLNNIKTFSSTSGSHRKCDFRSKVKLPKCSDCRKNWHGGTLQHPKRHEHIIKYTRLRNMSLLVQSISTISHSAAMFSSARSTSYIAACNWICTSSFDLHSCYSSFSGSLPFFYIAATSSYVLDLYRSFFFWQHFNSL